MALAATDDELSPGSAALMMLIWQEPTDRALAGWSPWSSWDPAEKDEAELHRWLRVMVGTNGPERRDMRRVRQR